MFAVSTYIFNDLTLKQITCVSQSRKRQLPPLVIWHCSKSKNESILMPHDCVNRKLWTEKLSVQQSPSELANIYCGNAKI